jgi:hypothetical protein
VTYAVVPSTATIGGGERHTVAVGGGEQLIVGREVHGRRINSLRDLEL